MASALARPAARPSRCRVALSCLLLLCALFAVGAPRRAQAFSAAALKQKAYVKASNTGSRDQFGDAVALDGETLVIGAPREASAAKGINGSQTNNDAVDAGAVYVFVRKGGGWVQEAYLKASNTQRYDNFGYSVAIAGNTIVVGAPGEDSAASGVNGNQTSNTAPGAGAAYVFVRAGTTWAQQAYLKASNPDSSDEFGSKVAISASTIVVGAPGEASGINGVPADDSSPAAGAAYVYLRTNTTWSLQAYLKASNMQADDLFGFDVAIDGDTIVVGAYCEASAATGVGGDQANNEAPYAGAAYVYVRSGTAWTQQAYLKPSNTEIADAFGVAVAIDGDTIVVGAAGEASAATGVGGDETDNQAPSAGAAYVYVRSGAAWSQQAYLKASNTQEGDLFGDELALAGDTLVVGAKEEDSAATGVGGDETDNSRSNAGAAYIFVRSGADWLQQAYLKASNSGVADWFGRELALTADTLVVGAPQESSGARGINGNQGDNSKTFAGAAYLFDTSGNRLKNGGFEQDFVADGRPDFWSYGSGFTRSNLVRYEGMYAGRHYSTGDSTYTVTQEIPKVLPGPSYRVSCWVNIPATSDSFTFKLQVRWLNADGEVLLGDTVGSTQGDTGGSWVEWSQILDPPADTKSASLQMVVKSLKATIYIDQCHFGSP